MKSDLHTLMHKRNLDAILITGPAQHNPAMYYLTGGGHLTHADLIQPRSGDAVLYYRPMERDEAAATGLKTKDITAFNWKELRAKAQGDNNLAAALRYKAMLTEQGITGGRLGIYGQVEIGPQFAVFSALQRIMPELEIVGESANDSLMLAAMMTKDEAEIERTRNMGRITTTVVGKVADFLTAHKVKNEALVKSDGEPLTIGEVKRKINLWLAEQGAENPHGTIFAIGSDAGVPHSTGTASDVLALGKTIVFDIFPCEAGGGYHYDFTRTWCLGYAPDEAQALYEDVLAVYRQVVSSLTPNAPFAGVQTLTCDLFEAQGHDTIRQNPAIQEGYVHSVGHGLGLHVHEAPWAGGTATEKDILAPGAVFTIEPGLYYPSRGMGCRLEDTFTVLPNGTIERLAEFPHDLVLPMSA